MMNRLPIIVLILIQVVYSSPALAERGYLARSYCGITDVSGQGYGITRDSAVLAAIESCIDEGGIPRCCARDAKVTDVVYKAFSYCSITNRSGTGYGYSLNDAVDRAISKCIVNGGIPSCCRKGTSY